MVDCQLGRFGCVALQFGVHVLGYPETPVACNLTAHLRSCL